jgi:FtsH-binding integral membrane protein
MSLMSMCFVPSFMGPILFSSLWALIIWGFIQLFFRPGPVGQMIYALLGAFIFSGYIVYDTYLLLARAHSCLLVRCSAGICARP